MSIRWRIALAMAAITAVATIAIGAVSFSQTRSRLLTEVDASLVALDQQIARGRLNPRALPQRGPLSGLFAQIVDRDGVVENSTFPDDAPVTEGARSVLGRTGASVFESVEVDGERYRVRSVGLGRGAIQLGRSLDETDRVLRSVGVRTVLWVVVVAAAAAAAGAWIAGRVTRSLRRLTDAAEHVEATGELDVEIDAEASDEVGRLGVAFDSMLGALRRSREQQQRLVQDAGHELRTPLTSLRTNLDTLRRYPDLPDGERDAIVSDLHAETSELTDLVNEIVAIATGEDAADPAVVFDLGEAVREVTERFERRTGRQIVVDAQPGRVRAQRSAVQRAVSCLLDNARKFDGSDGPIDVAVGDATVRVADRGPGIPAGDREVVFERFYRADEARAMAGSGLGLSIVREVAERHGGDAFAGGRPGGGAIVGFRLGAVTDRPGA